MMCLFLGDEIDQDEPPAAFSLQTGNIDLPFIDGSGADGDVDDGEDVGFSSAAVSSNDASSVVVGDGDGAQDDVNNGENDDNDGPLPSQDIDQFMLEID